MLASSDSRNLILDLTGTEHVVTVLESTLIMTWINNCQRCPWAFCRVYLDYYLVQFLCWMQKDALEIYTHLALIFFKKSQITPCILNFITRKFAKSRFVFNIGRDGAAQTGRSNNVDTLDIKIEIQTQRTGLSAVFVAINSSLKIAKINVPARSE